MVGHNIINQAGLGWVGFRLWLSGQVIIQLIGLGWIRLRPSRVVRVRMMWECMHRTSCTVCNVTSNPAPADREF